MTTCPRAPRQEGPEPSRRDGTNQCGAGSLPAWFQARLATRRQDARATVTFTTRAFTLIELLVVVAIIAILAAIATPNFLLAQTRSKIARAQADQRTLATALECYAVDANTRYPAYGNPRDYAGFTEPVVFVPVAVTTPVAYATSLPPDVFPGKRTGLDPAAGPTTYFYMHGYETTYLDRYQEDAHVETHHRALTGNTRAVKWTVWSLGRDMNDDHGTKLYDPSNGTVSDGDMMGFGP